MEGFNFLLYDFCIVCFFFSEYVRCLPYGGKEIFVFKRNGLKEQ